MKIVIIGSGNVATHLSLALKKAGEDIVQVYSRSLHHAEQLAKRVEAEAVDDVSKLVLNANLYLIAIVDAYINEVAQKMPLVDGVVAHTAASIPASVLSRFTHHGVFYPFQTFTKEKVVDFNSIPILLEANNEPTFQVLSTVGKRISEKVILSDEDKRKALHIAAIFACNFVNHLYTLADSFLEKHNMGFDMLETLICETTQKALSMPPKLAQTGPAQRGDKSVIDSHLKILGEGTIKYDIYQLLSQSIMVSKE